ncbi:MAG: GDSL-type esterase/lipase family protein [Thermoplasmatota archaeon]
MEEIVRLNELIRAHCRGEGVRLADAFKVFEGDDGRLLREYSHGDGGHLNAAGYRRLGEFLSMELVDLLKPGATVACLGDSITEGYPGHINGRTGNEWEPYTRYLMRPGVRVLNLGVSGDTTEGMMVRLHRDVSRSGADICIVLGGVNDLLGGVPVREVFENLRAMYAELDRYRILPVAVTVLPID